jgi:fructose-bisphosphate aldolase / 2-amino-3,7-dideoxy-D-threo-hept-6-ulosonate synthase
MSAGTGKTMRMSRIFDANGNAVIFAPVHNSTSVDPFHGQLDVPAVVTEAARAGATAMNLTKGSIRDCAPTWIGGIGALHYTFSYTPLGPDPIRQVEVGTVEESLRLGADGVCLFVGLATANDYEVVSAIGRIADECDRHGLVFVCEAEFPGFYDSMEESLERYGLRYLKYTARLCAELGADIVTSNWPGHADQFAEIVDYVKIPVLINGGPQVGELEFLQRLQAAREAGGRGCLVGRNFSETGHLDKTVRASSLILREGRAAADVYEELGLGNEA